MINSTEYWINKGIITLEDNAEFRVILDAVKCFKLGSVQQQSACFNHPMESNKSLWFPSLSEQKGDWLNRIKNKDENIIYEISISSNPSKIKEHLDDYTKNPKNKDIKTIRVTFPKEKNGLYVFKGIYKVDPKKSNEIDGLAWVRITTETKTYK